jgi:hypothetical protein
MQNPDVQNHLREEDLIDLLYMSAPETGPIAEHLRVCAACSDRLNELPKIRTAREQANEVNVEFLAAQRRRIYQRIEHEERTWWHAGVRRWAMAASLAIALVSGVAVFKQYEASTPRNTVSDTQLAVEVAQFAADSEAKPTAPLRGLFEE